MSFPPAVRDTFFRVVHPTLIFNRSSICHLQSVKLDPIILAHYVEKRPRPLYQHFYLYAPQDFNGRGHLAATS